MTDQPVWQNSSGAHSRILSLCNAMASDGLTVLLCYTNWLRYPDRLRLRTSLPGARLLDLGFHHALLRGLNKGLQKAGIRREGDPHAERRNMVRWYCTRYRPRFVLIEYVWNTCLLDGLRESLDYQPILMLDTHDVQHLRTVRLHDLNQRAAFPITKDKEAKLLRYYDVLIAIQQQEATVLRQMCPELRVIVAGHPGKVTKEAKAVREGPLTLLFVAGGGAHNVHAILHFMEEVWPQLFRIHCERITLRIVGKVSEALNAAVLPEGIVCSGYIHDLEAVYHAADMVINPIQAGSGLKIKNVEALCHGLPLVTTPAGAEGLEEGAGTAFIVCNTTADFVASLDQLIRRPDQRLQLACAAQAFATANFQEEFVYRELFTFLRSAPFTNF